MPRRFKPPWTAERVPGFNSPEPLRSKAEGGSSAWTNAVPILAARKRTKVEKTGNLQKHRCRIPQREVFEVPPSKGVRSRASLLSSAQRTSRSKQTLPLLLYASERKTGGWR